MPTMRADRVRHQASGSSKQKLTAWLANTVYETATAANTTRNVKPNAGLIDSAISPASSTLPTKIMGRARQKVDRTKKGQQQVCDVR